MRDRIWVGVFTKKNCEFGRGWGGRFFDVLVDSKLHFIHGDWEVIVLCRGFLAGGEINRD